MDSDIQIRDRLDRELAESTPPPLGSLVAHAMADGDRLRRRRRLAMVTSSVAVVAVLSTAAFIVAQTGRGGPPAALLPAEPKSTPSATVTHSSVGPIPAGHAAATGEAVVALLIDLLPPGGQLSEIEFSSESQSVWGSFLYDDGHGAATVMAQVTDRPADYGPEVTGMRCPANEEGLTCTHQVTTEGVEVRIMTMGPYGPDCTDMKCSIKDLRVEIKRLDGTYVITEAYNGPAGHDRAATRADTLVNAEQLLAMANDPRWGLTMSSSFVDSAKQAIPLLAAK